jgi:hypothetical protein
VIPREDLVELSDRARRDGAILVTTEKDEARFLHEASDEVPRFVLRVGIQFAAEPDLSSFLPPGLRER